MKKVLLISPKFFEYPSVITNGLKKIGYEVDWYDDRPSNHNLIKAMLRVNRNLISMLGNAYFKKMLHATSNEKYEHLILIIGQSTWFSEKMIVQLKNEMPNTQFVAYIWDPIKNCKYVTKELIDKFDKCYSFEKNDVNKYKNIKFLPLFYSPLYEQIASEIMEIKYDITYIGTAHPQKYKFINLMSKQLQDVYMRQYIYHYMPSKLKFYYHKIKDKEFANANKNEFRKDKISQPKMIDIISKSRCILDSPQKGQEGLTIRTIECLGADKKIITTNKDIKNYDFYQEENIYIYNGNFDFKSKFFSEPYKNIEKEIYKKYALENWLKTLLN